MSDAALETTLEQALGAQRAGRLSEAQVLYCRVLAEQPRHAVANHNLGVVTAQGGAVEAALPHFKAALEADPGQAVYWISYARGLAMGGQAEAALRVLGIAEDRGLAGPLFKSLKAQALVAMGDSMAARGELSGAIETYRAALAIDPELSVAHFHLGSVLSEGGRIAEGFAHFMRYADLNHEAAAAEGRHPEHRLKHDREQGDYLESLGLEARGFHLAGGDRISTPAVNPANRTAERLAHWRRAEPQILVMDDFLTPEALSRLRDYCAGSTIWKRNYEAGYIGATPQDGFACPLLAQIAEEIQSTWPEIFAPHRFRYLGAFKYDSSLSRGTNTHADNSAVNVNFYIAPDEANLDPASGGMQVWDEAAPDEPTMRRLNSDEAGVRAFLEARGAQSTIVPHGTNRAVFFNSALFHKTDDCRFTEGYLNKRINVSLLFGEFGAPTR